MIWTHIKRISQAGFWNFWRNATVTLSSVLVMIIALFFIGSVVFVSVLLASAMSEIRSKVDIRVYFVTGAPEADVLAIKDKLTKLSGVEKVDYVSQEQALIDFKNKHAKDQSVLQALSELDKNPLGATLQIRTKDLSQYSGITTLLKDKEFLPEKKDIIDTIDVDSNETKKLAIERLTKIIQATSQLGLVLIIVLVVISVLIIFNTIRLVIYMSRDEISVMKLVGATNAYVRGPFLVTGVMYGLVAGIIVMGIFAPITHALVPFGEAFGVINLAQYYMTNILPLAGLIIGSGIVIGGVSSYLAVRRYLKV